MNIMGGLKEWRQENNQTVLGNANPSLQNSGEHRDTCGQGRGGQVFRTVRSQSTSKNR